MMNRRDFLRSFVLTGGLWVLGESAGPIFAAPDKGTSEWPNHPFLQFLRDLKPHCSRSR